MKHQITRPIVACPKCNNSGVVPMSDDLFEVLSFFHRHDGFWSAQMLVKRLKIAGTPTKMNQRLESLRAIGLLSRQRNSRTFLYFLNPPPKH